MAVLNRDGGRFVVRYHDEHGDTREQSFGRGPDAEAAAIKYDMQWKDYHQAMRMYQKQQKVESATPQAVRFRDVVDEYVKTCSINGKSKNHIYLVGLVAKTYFYPFFCETPIEKIDYAQHIIPFIDKLKSARNKKGELLSVHTYNKYCIMLKTLFKYAINRGYIIANPMQLWKKTFAKRKEIELTHDDLIKIKNNASPHVAWAIEVAYNVGVRPGQRELFALTWQDVDYARKRVHVFGSKTKTDRYVPVSDEFLAHLQEKQQKAVCDRIVSYRGKPLKQLNKGFANACKKAGIPYHVRLYDIRHRYASDLLNAGAPVGVVSKALGHSTISTTLNHYYECLPQDMDVITAKLPSLSEPVSAPMTPGSVAK